MDVILTEDNALENVSKTEELKQKGSPLSSILFVFLVVVLGIAVVFYTGPFMSWMHLSSYLALGFFYKTFFPDNSQWTESKRFYYIVLSAIAISGAFILAGILLRPFQPAVYFSYGSAFLFPVILQEAWDVYNKLSVWYGNIWYYTNELPEKTIFLNLEEVPVRIKIRLNGNDLSVASKIPKHLNLGIGFYFAVEEQNRVGAVTTKLVNEEKIPYGWIFYTIDFGIWKRSLAPEKTISENRLRSRSTIVALRIEPTSGTQNLSKALPTQNSYDSQHS